MANDLFCTHLCDTIRMHLRSPLGAPCRDTRRRLEKRWQVYNAALTKDPHLRLGTYSSCVFTSDIYRLLYVCVRAE